MLSPQCLDSVGAARYDRTVDAISVIEKLFKNFGTWPDYEFVLQKSYEKFLKSDSVIFDVGAHSGTHLQHYVRIADRGTVVAFEPLPDLFRQLVGKFQPDGRGLTIYNLALSKEMRHAATFVRAEGSLPESGLRQREYNQEERVNPVLINVEVETIDRISARHNFPKIDYIKMDIEGGELDALQGGLSTLMKYRPIVSVEWGGQSYKAYGHEEDSLFNFSTSISYKIFDPFMQFIGSYDLWSFAKARYCWDYFLVPDERVSEFKSPFFDQ